MNLMNFFLSTNISIGIGLFEKISDFIHKQNAKKPGIIFDANLQKSDYFNNNIDNIKKSFPNALFVKNEKNGEPTYAYLEKIKEKFSQNTPDIIIAIGGGSTMDIGKGVALLLTNNVPALSLKGFPKNVVNPLPLITIPSILGSGSEVSYNAVFIDEKENRKLGINTKTNFPVATIIDPLLTMSAPTNAVISSAMDTLVHCVDSFGSKKSTILSKNFSKEGFNQTFTTLLNKNLNDPESRISLAIGSICGITALMNSGDGPTNGFAYYFGVKNKIPHGLAGGIFLKEVMQWNYRNGYNKYSDLLNQANEKLFDQLNILYKKLEIPKISKYGYNKKDVKNLSIKVSKALDGSFSGNPIPFDENSAEEVLNQLI
tara:strand:- start:1212 stop:2327 length:1116 start_codon:yes stop_codon:yes gene_type:complete